MSPTDIHEYLRPGERLVDDDPFWQHQSRGLSAFLSSDGLITFKLPFEVDESVVLDNCFHVTQMLPLHSRNGVFYMLELGLHNKRLFQAGKYSYHEIQLHDVPSNIEEAFRFDDSQAQLQSHNRLPERRGDMNAVSHGHGTGIDERKDEIHRFFLEVESGTSAMLADSRSPLILIGLDYLQSLYRKVNSHPYLLSKGVVHNSEKSTKTETLHARARELVEPEIDRSMQDVRELFNELARTDRTESGIEAIARASLDDRVDTLFINPREERPGRIDHDGVEAEADLSILQRFRRSVTAEPSTLWTLPKMCRGLRWRPQSIAIEDGMSVHNGDVADMLNELADILDIGGIKKPVDTRDPDQQAHTQGLGSRCPAARPSTSPEE